MKTKIAIGTWAYIFGPYFKKPISLPDTVKRLAELKFDGLELCGFRPHGHPDDYPTPDSRKKLKDMIASAGLGIAGLAGDFEGQNPATSKRGAYEKVFRKQLKFCTDLGIKKIRVDTVSPPPLPAGMDYAAALKAVSRTWRCCAGMAQREGVLMTWEFEPGFAFNKPSDIMKMLDAVDHPNFKVMFDTCHAHMCSVVAARQAPPPERLRGGAVEFARMLKGKIGHVHLIDSDNTLHGNETSTHAPFGDGVLDFDELMPAILEAGYTDEWWVIDLCFWGRAWEVTARCQKFVEKLRKRYGK